MRRFHQAAGVAFLALALFAVIEAHDLTYYTPLGPGPGFFPFWLGAILTVLSIVYLGLLSWRCMPAVAQDFIPDRRGIIRMASILLALILFIAVVGVLGFAVTAFMFLSFLLFVLGRQHPVLTLVISLLGSFGLYYGFLHWLGVQLPSSSTTFLQDLGL